LQLNFETSRLFLFNEKKKKNGRGNDFGNRKAKNWVYHLFLRLKIDKKNGGKKYFLSNIRGFQGNNNGFRRTEEKKVRFSKSKARMQRLFFTQL